MNDTPISFLQEVKNEQARAKVGIFGAQGSGKSTTAALLALAVSKIFHNGAPVAMQDTENGSDYLKPIFDAEGVKFLVNKSGAFADMEKTLREAERIQCCAFIEDSVTHTWRELNEAYAARKIQIYNSNHTGQISSYDIQFQDWKELKKAWGFWTYAFLNSPLHCFVCGRAGYEYEYQVNDKGKRELVKGDTKMKAESEFGYEPSLLIEMEAERDGTSDGHGGSFTHIAHVLKDRTRALNGKHFEFRTLNDYKVGDWKKVYAVFEPHFKFLNITGTQRAMTPANSEEIFEAQGGESKWQKWVKEKTIALEEITATMQLMWPGRSDADKTTRIRAMEIVFGMRSWSAVEGLGLSALEDGLSILRQLEGMGSFETPDKMLESLKGLKPLPKPQRVEKLIEDEVAAQPIKQELAAPAAPQESGNPQGAAANEAQNAAPSAPETITDEQYYKLNDAYNDHVPKFKSGDWSRLLSTCGHSGALKLLPASKYQQLLALLTPKQGRL